VESICHTNHIEEPLTLNLAMVKAHETCFRRAMSVKIHLNYFVLCAKFDETYPRVAADTIWGGPATKASQLSLFHRLGERGKCVARNVRPLTRNCPPFAAIVAVGFLISINPAKPANTIHHRLNGAGSRLYSVT